MLFEQIQSLYNQQLYDDVKTLASLALTHCEHNPEQSGIMIRYQILCLQAEAYYHCGQYRQAEACFQSAIQMKKIIKGKGKGQNLDSPTEVEMKYHLHECYIYLKQTKEAVHTLESISAKHRSCKVNLALATLYQKTGGNDRSAVTAYKEVLRENPLSISAIKGLLALGVKSQEVEMLVRSPLPSSTNLEWLNLWIKGHGHLAVKEFSPAASTLSGLDIRPLLYNNVELLASIGEAQFMNGEYSLAMTTLKRVRHLDRMYVPKMDLFAYLLYREHCSDELETLALNLLGVTETSPEPWIALGYYNLQGKLGAAGRLHRVSYFAQKALEIDSRNVDGMLLKGMALMEAKEPKKSLQALMEFREAIRLAPYRFEAHSCLVDAYMACDRMRDAVTAASEVCKNMPSARTYTLCAVVLSKDTATIEKAKSCLEKAIKLDPTYLDAVYTLVGILRTQQQYDAAISLLEEQINLNPTSRLHQLLAEFLRRKKDHQAAFDHFAIALRLDPSNSKATSGMMEVEKQGSIATDRTPDDDSSDNEEQFRSTSHPSRSTQATTFEFDASGSEGELDMPSDGIVFS